MEYSAAFFSEKKYPSHNTKYDYYLRTGFYDVFIDKDGKYHMAIEEKESLIARFSFFKKIKTIPYPVLSDRDLTEKEQEIERYRQVIGLPYDVITKEDDKHQVVLRSEEEILASISFEKGLFIRDKRLKPENHDFYIGNKRYIAQAINYAIAHGVYFLHPELLASDTGLFYPFLIDIKRLPAEFVTEEETADKIIVDFVSNPLSITKKVYLEYYKPLDELSLEEKCQKAFQHLSTEEHERRAQEALRRYFYSIASALFNRFFKTEYKITVRNYTSVLEHKEMRSVPYAYPYFGTHYTAYAKRERTIYKEGDEYKEVSTPSGIYFDSSDKVRMRFGFDSVKRYLLNHDEMNFIPAVFLKLMGLPSVVLSIFERFDFRSATSDDFVKLLKFKKGISIEKMPAFEISATGDGFLYYAFPRNPEKYLHYFFSRAEDAGVFISNPEWISINKKSEPYIFSYDKKSAQQVNIFANILLGDYSTYRGALDLIPAEIRTSASADYEAMSDILINHSKADKVEVPEKYFDYLSDGFDSEEGKSYLFSLGVDGDCFTKLLTIVSMYCFGNKVQILRWTENFIDDDPSVSDYLLKEEVIYNPFLEYPYIHKGYYFLGYSKEIDSPVYFDYKDIVRMRELYNIIRPTGNYLIAEGVDSTACFYVSEKKPLNKLLGLPDSAEPLKIKKKQLDYPYISLDNISIFERKEFASLITSDEDLTYLKALYLALDDGVIIRKNRHNILPVQNDGDGRAKDVVDLLSSDRMRQVIASVSFLTDSYKDRNLIRLMEGSHSLMFFMRKVYGFEFLNTINDPDCRLIYEVIYQLSNTLRDYYYNKARGKKTCLLTFTDENGETIAPGFGVWARILPDGSPAFSKEDLELLNKSVKACYGFCPEDMDDMMKRYLIVDNSIAPAYCSSIVYAYSIPDSKTDADKLRKELEITEESFDYDKLPTLYGFSNFIDIDVNTIAESHQLIRYLLKEGYYISPISDYSDVYKPDYILTIENNSDRTKQDFLHLCYVFKDCTGIVKEVFKPSKTLHDAYLNDFFFSSNLEQANPELSSIVKEMLAYAFNRDPYFLIDARNHLSKGEKKLSKYLKSVYKGYKLSSKNHKKAITSSFIFVVMLYLYYLDGLVVCGASDQILKN